MKYRIGAIVTTVSLMAVLTGCGATPGAEREGINYQVTTIPYEGNDLNCITWNGSHGEIGVDCDWVEYHEKYGFNEE